MAAALSTTLRAALPRAPRRAQGALRLHRGEALVRRLDGDAERLKRRRSASGFLERRAGRPARRRPRGSAAARPPRAGASISRTARRRPGGRVRGVTAALDRPPRAGQASAAVAVGHADPPAAEVEGRAPGRRACRPGVGHRPRRRSPGTRTGAAAPRPARPRSARGPCRRPAPARPSPPPPPPTSGPRARPAAVASGSPPVAAAMAALAPSGDPPSTTARTPSWRSTAWASERSARRLDVVAPGHHHPAVAPPAGQAAWPRPRSTAGAARQLLLGLALALHDAADGRHESSSGSVRSSSGRHRTRSLALGGPGAAPPCPVRAKMRRVFDPMEPSETRVIGPIWPE